MRTKINFKTINKGSYTIIPAKDIAETSERIKKEMKRFVKQKDKL
jgi:hypothetical protein